MADISMDATGSLSIVGSAAMVRDPGLSATAALSVTGSPSMIRDPGFFATAALAITAAPAMALNPGFHAIGLIAIAGSLGLPKNIPLGANCPISISSLVGFSRIVSIAATGGLEFGSRACVDRGRNAIGLCEVMADILHLWGFTDPRSAPGYAVNRALTDVNSSLQTVWNQSKGRKYWSETTLEITLAADASSSDLADDIQNITGSCRLQASRRTLAACGTLSELEQFHDIYLDGNNSSEPVAYHIERKAQAANDPVQCTFHVVPAPTEETVFLLEAVKEAPRYGIRDLADCPRIPIPHRYVESLLLPVARHRATSYYLFTASDKKEAIEAEYAEARVALGMADPLPGNAGDNRNERKEARA